MSEQGVGRVDDSLCRFNFRYIRSKRFFVKQMDKRRISSRSYQIRSSSSNVADLIFSLHSFLSPVYLYVGSIQHSAKT